MPEPRAQSYPASSPARALVRWLGVGLLVVSIGCAREEAAATREASASPDLTVQQPQAHLMPGMGAVYFSIVNPSDAGDRLVAIETAAARAAETHETLEEGGVVRMVPRPDGFEIPPRGTLELRPGGKHVMLIEPAEASAGSATIRLKLHFERAAAIEIDVPIMTTDQMAMEGMEH